MALINLLPLTGVCVMEYHCSFRMLFPCTPHNYPSSVSFHPAWQTFLTCLSFFFLGDLLCRNWISQEVWVLCVSPYLCPDCSGTWNHSPHYRWLSPENQKRSDWPQTHGGSVCRDSSLLRNLFECHLRWRAPSLREGGNTYAKVRKDSDKEEKKWMQQRSIKQEPPRRKGEKDILQSHSS